MSVSNGVRKLHTAETVIYLLVQANAYLSNPFYQEQNHTTFYIFPWP
jgi:hypothetical protein